MKVIDFHIHVAPPDHFTPWVQAFFQKNNPAWFERFSGSVRAEDLLEYLDGQGVDRAVLLSEYAPKASGVIPNEYTAGICRGTDRLIPFGSVDLGSSESVEEQARRAVEDLGVRGFKMLPSYARFWPGEERLFPLYRIAGEKGLPVIFHTGTSLFRGTRVKYADPLLLDEVADAFPDLKIVMAHGGRPFWYDRARWMLSRHENVTVDITGMPVPRLPELFPGLEARAERFLFGSDWPGAGEIRPRIEAVRALPLSDEAKEKILFRNAERLLAGSSPEVE
jgi:predicted TIM-barrel fold metal-dependent hydrolase